MGILLHIMSFDVRLVMFASQLFEFDPTLAISTLVVVLMLDDIYDSDKVEAGFEMPDASESSQEPRELLVWVASRRTIASNPLGQKDCCCNAGICCTVNTQTRDRSQCHKSGFPSGCCTACHAAACLW